MFLSYIAEFQYWYLWPMFSMSRSNLLFVQFSFTLYSFRRLMMIRKLRYVKLSVLFKLLRYAIKHVNYFTFIFLLIEMLIMVYCFYLYYYLQEELMKAKFEATSKVNQLEEVQIIWIAFFSTAQAVIVSIIIYLDDSPFLARQMSIR